MSTADDYLNAARRTRNTIDRMVREEVQIHSPESIVRFIAERFAGIATEARRKAIEEQALLCEFKAVNQPDGAFSDACQSCADAIRQYADRAPSEILARGEAATADNPRSQPSDSRAVAINYVAYRWYRYSGCDNDKARDDLNMLVGWLEEIGLSVAMPGTLAREARRQAIEEAATVADDATCGWNEPLMHEGAAIAASAIRRALSEIPARGEPQEGTGDPASPSRASPFGTGAASASPPPVTPAIAVHARSLKRHIDNAHFRQTSEWGSLVSTGYEYIEMPLWEARHLLGVLSGAAQAIEVATPSRPGRGSTSGESAVSEGNAPNVIGETDE